MCRGSKAHSPAPACHSFYCDFQIGYRDTHQFSLPVMDDLIRHGNLAIRLMRDNLVDYECVAHWLSDPRVLEFYDGRDCPLTLAGAIEKYSPRILTADGVTPCFLILQDKPVGYLQYYAVADENKEEYGLSTIEDATGRYAFDQFIGEPELWNQGLGTRAVMLLVEYLFRDKAARKIVIDPQARNLRAIRCYEKSGFRKVKLLPGKEFHEGKLEDCWLMELGNRSHFQELLQKRHSFDS
jgi:aminoglycoside 6'-N-acetyltransferase